MSPMNGPQVLVVPNAFWDKQMQDDGVEVSYPIGAYIKTDSDGIPDADDKVRIKEDLWLIILRQVKDNDRLTWSEKRAIMLLFHEYLHAKVPSLEQHRLQGGSEKSWEALKETYSHPPSSAGLMAQVKHAIRTGFGINAFTRWLRWSTGKPVGAWDEGWAWLKWLIANPENIKGGA